MRFTIFFENFVNRIEIMMMIWIRNQIFQRHQGVMQCKTMLKDHLESGSEVVEIFDGIELVQNKVQISFGILNLEFVVGKNNNGVPIVMGIVRHKNE